MLNEFGYMKVIASHDLDFIWKGCGEVATYVQNLADYGIVIDSMEYQMGT